MNRGSGAVRQWSRYLTPTVGHRRLGLVCLGVGEQSGPVPPCRDRVLGLYGAVLLVRGEGRLRWGDPPRTRRLAAPVLFWLTPDVVHTYGPDRRGWSESWVLFDGDAAAGYEELGYLSRGDPAVELADPVPLARVFARMRDVCLAEGPGVDVEAAALVHQLIVTARHSRRGSAGTDDVAVLAALRDDAHRPLGVGEHARRLGLSVGALRDVVRRAAACTPKEYILGARLNRAKRLLAESDAAVATVGRAVGYDDPAYFTRIFTRRTGLSPRAFRTRQRRAASTSGDLSGV